MKPSLFDNRGHLTDQALQSLMHQELDELQCYEAAEHLSYCDFCTARYTDLLCEAPLLAPPKPLADTVFRKIKMRAKVLLFNRYTTMTAAAALALVFWVGGFFTPEITSTPNKKEDPCYKSPFTIVGERIEEAKDSLAKEFETFLDSIRPKGE